MTADDAGRLVKVYKSQRKQDAYLYVDFTTDLGGVPEALLTQFHEPELVLTFKLTALRTLAQANPADVLAGIESDGFYLQLPATDGGVDAAIRRAAE